MVLEWMEDPEKASPYWRHLGIKVVKAGEGSAHLTMEFSPRLTQVYGVIHGGALASLADSAAAAALASTTENFSLITTVELSMNYLKPVSRETVHAYARVINRGRRLSLIEVRLENADQEIVAYCKTTYYLR